MKMKNILKEDRSTKHGMITNANKKDVAEHSELKLACHSSKKTSQNNGICEKC